MEFPPPRLRGVGAVPVWLDVSTVIPLRCGIPAETPVEVAKGIDRRWSPSIGAQMEAAVSMFAGTAPFFLGKDGGEEEGEEGENNRQLHF